MPILAPPCKLKLARLSGKLRIQDGAECGNIFVLVLFYNLATYIKVVGKNKHKFVQKVAKDYILIYFVSFVVCHVFFWEIFGSSVVLVKLVY